MIGIITVNPDTFTNPTLYSIIKKLNEKGVLVTLFCGYQQAPIPKELNLTRYADLPKGVFLPRRPLLFLKYVYIFLLTIIFIKKNKIKHVLAVDIFGLVLAGRINKFLRFLKIHYCCFEIFFLDEIKQNSGMLKLKRKEIHYSQNLASILIQDNERKKLLEKENNLKLKFQNWFFIPVSPIKYFNEPDKYYKKSDFGLKETAIVYVHSGSVSQWSGSDVIINAIEEGLPKDTFILIHNREKFNSENPIHSKLFELKTRGANLILHDEFFENYANYNSFLKCFDYGITIYIPDGGIFTGKNISEIGLASGKLSSYMLAGLPTLLSACTTYKNLLKEYKVGVIITEQKSLSYHIKEHSLSDVNRLNCNEFYNQVLDPNDKIESFINFLST